MVLKRKKVKKKKKKGDFISKIRHHPKNIFSTTAGLKGYKVRGKRFKPTKQGYLEASRYASKVFSKYGKARVEFIY